MKIYQYKNREEYLSEQVVRYRHKHRFCKVFFADLFRYHDLLKDLRKPIESILCLGVRTGAEVDMFRAVFFSPFLRARLLRNFLVRQDTGKSGAEKIRLANRFGIGSGSNRDGKVVGVELAEEARRDGIWIGSFDELPPEWTGKFDLIYSNSIDHSSDPQKTVDEWKRVASPGAHAIILFSEGREASNHDPFGGITFQVLKDLWKAPVVFEDETSNLNGYSEICFRL